MLNIIIIIINIYYTQTTERKGSNVHRNLSFIQFIVKLMNSGIISSISNNYGEIIMMTKLQ